MAELNRAPNLVSATDHQTTPTSKSDDVIGPVPYVLALQNAPMADLLRKPISDEASDFVAHLYDLMIKAESKGKPRKRARRDDYVKTMMQTIAAFSGDLIHVSENASSLGYCYRSTNKGEFTNTIATSRNFETLATLWADMGLIEVVKGFQGQTEFDGEPMKGKGWARRLRATPILLQIGQSHGIASDNLKEHFLKDHDVSFPLELRRTKTTGGPRYSYGRKMKVTKTDHTTSLVDQIRELNAFLAKHSFNLDVPPQLKRIFNNGDAEDFNWNKGGRLIAIGQGNYQSMGSAARANITINDEPVVEIDIKASHLTVFHALNKSLLKLETDPYDVRDVPRDLVKSFVNSSFGQGRLPMKWSQSICKDYKAANGRPIGKDYPFDQTKHEIISRHQILLALNSSQVDWAVLQYWESRILVDAILCLLREFQIPSLPVHDSLVVRSRDLKCAQRVLSDCFETILEVRPMLTVK